MGKFTCIPWKNLNSQQQQAIETQGIVCVNADMGMGKTTTFVNKINFLLQNKIPYGGILALVQNNFLAKTIRKETGLEDVHTIQSFCLKVLQESYRALGLKENFTVYTENKHLLLETIKQLHLSIPPDEFIEICNYIANCKKNNLLPTRYLDIFNKYQELLTVNNAIDNDSIIAQTVSLFEKNKCALTYYRYRYSYILVDDYQEYNFIQNKLLKLLCMENLFLTRDTNNTSDEDFLYLLAQKKPVQQINFKEKYVTNAIDKKSVNVFIAKHQEEEAQYIASQIANKIKQGESYDQIAIILKDYTYSNIIESALLKKRIPYKNNKNLYKHKDINKILSAIRFIYNPYDIQSFCSLLTLENKKIEKLKSFFYKTKCDVLTGLKTAINTKLIAGTQYLKEIFFRLCKMRKQSLVDNISDLISNKSFLLPILTIAKNVSNYKEFLNHFVLNDIEEPQQGINIITYEESKGMEYATIFLPYLLDKITPNQYLQKNMLFSKIIQQAKNEIFLTCAVCIEKFQEKTFYSPSSFLEKFHKFNLINEV